MLHVQYYQPTNSEYSGSITFNGRASGANITTDASATNNGNAFAEFLRGVPSSIGLREGIVVNHLFESDYAGFAQDDYKILDKLTINIGLRYEYQALMHEKNGQLSIFDPNVTNSTGSQGAIVLANESGIGGDAGVQAVLNTYGIGPNNPTNTIYPYIMTAAQAGLPQTLVNPNHLRFAPRVGWAWRPSINNSLVVRGSYGIFYTGSRLSALRTELSGQLPFSVVDAPDTKKQSIQNVFILAPNVHATTANGYDPKCSFVVPGELQSDLGKGTAQGTGGRIGVLRFERDSPRLAGRYQSGRAESVHPLCTPATGPLSGSSYPRPLAFPAQTNTFQFAAIKLVSVQCILELQRRHHHRQKKV